MGERKVPVVACPQCGASAPFSAENKWRPFCSERCRTIDLGYWASEAYRIPDSAATSPEDDASSE